MSLELLVKSAFSRLGLQVQRPPKRLWEGDPVFQRLLAGVAGRSLLDATRLFMLYQLALQSLPAAGDAAEVGVYRGGTARLLAETLAGSGKTLRLFDTFAGMPQTDAARDVHRAGDFKDTSEASVRTFLAGLSNVSFHAGLFPATAQALTGSFFSFVHLDVDIYRSILDGCGFFYPRLSPGGVLVFDDYGTPTCPGVQQAVDEFFAGKAERPLYLPTGQAVVVKR